MKLVYYPENLVVNMKAGETTSLVLENPRYYERFLMAFYGCLMKQNDDFALGNGDKELDISKKGELIASPFNLTYDKREIQKKLFSELEGIAFEEDYASELASANGMILSTLEKLRFSSVYEIDYKEDLSVSDFLKVYDVHMCEPEGTFIERLIDYIKTTRGLLGRELFVIANCDAYMREEDYPYLEECAAKYEVAVLFLRNRQISLRKGINEYIIDEDLCEIR